MNKYYLPYVEFYITNVCNLSCQNCNRFNNFHFTGFQRWEDYASDYEKWSKLISFEDISILGGEPLLNPTILEWLYGIRKLWPSEVIKITTNGTRLNKVAGLYDCILKTRSWIEISLHDNRQHNELDTIIRTFLTDPVVTQLPDGVQYLDKNFVKVIMYPKMDFSTSSVYKDQDGFHFHNSDPIRAHENCAVKDSHHFIRGRFYKCGPAALMSEFAQQQNMILLDEDFNLLNNYKGVGPNDTEELLNSFFATLKEPIPQCKFCPNQYKTYRIDLIEYQDR